MPTLSQGSTLAVLACTRGYAPAWLCPRSVSKHFRQPPQFIKTGKVGHQSIIDDLETWAIRVKQYKKYDKEKDRQTALFTVCLRACASLRSLMLTKALDRRALLSSTKGLHRRPWCFVRSWHSSSPSRTIVLVTRLAARCSRLCQPVSFSRNRTLRTK